MIRRQVFILVIFFVFLALLVRLLFLQIVHGDFYYKKSENNRIQLIKNIAPRGRIYDCNKELLVDNRPSLCASLIPWLAGSRIDEVLKYFKKISEIDTEEIKEKIKKQRFRPFQPLLIIKDLPPQIVSKILESGNEFPGVIIEAIPSRHYPNHSLCAHILGYVQEISEKDLERMKDEGYEQGDPIGQAGIERSYEKFLRGTSGGIEIEIDAHGKPSNPSHIIGEKKSITGADIVLTIDKKIQESCESALKGKRGAIVVLSPFNGDILGMASSPAFDPNIFTVPISPLKWQKIINNPGHPMFNRSIQATYPPGSAFKIVVAMAALEEGKIETGEVFNCEGMQKAGQRIYKCWKKEGHGFINFTRGVAESCDVYFYHLGTRLGPEIIGKYARLCGFGFLSGIDMGGEKRGIIPDPEWKKKTVGERWFLGDTFNFSIGQGYILCTPLQMVNTMNVLFNGGKLYKPRIVKEILFKNYERKRFGPQLTGEINLKPSTIETMKTALRSVVTRGTGILSNIPEAEVFGKTGTAQNPGGEDHAWFVCFAKPDVSNPAVDPNAKPVSIVVFIENGGSGSATACPIAAQVLRSIFQI